MPEYLSQDRDSVSVQQSQCLWIIQCITYLLAARCEVIEGLLGILWHSKGCQGAHSSRHTALWGGLLAASHVLCRHSDLKQKVTHLLSCRSKVLEGLLGVLWDSKPSKVRIPQAVQCAGVVLLSSLLEPLQGCGVASLYTHSISIHVPQMCHRMGISCLCCLPVTLSLESDSYVEMFMDLILV